MSRQDQRLLAAEDRGGLAMAARALRHRRYGITALLVFLLLGYTLEALHGFKTPSYLLDPMRRELWTLAHLHGAFLALLNLFYSAWDGRDALSASRGRIASGALLAGSLLLPVGFFLGGLVHYEGDPGAGIFLVPIGGLLVIVAVALHVPAAWRRESR